jgi:hypothetical protein
LFVQWSRPRADVAGVSGMGVSPLRSWQRI